MATIETSRDAYFRKGKRISEIAREQKVDRKTVRKFINQDDWNEPVRRQARVSSKLEAFKPVIDGWLEEDKRRRRKQRHTAKRIWQRLRAEYAEEGFDASYRTVAAYVSGRRADIYRESSAALPLVHRAGEAQADFGEADFIENGTHYHGAYLVVTFPASNAGLHPAVQGAEPRLLAHRAAGDLQPHRRGATAGVVRQRLDDGHEDPPRWRKTAHRTLPALRRALRVRTGILQPRCRPR